MTSTRNAATAVALTATLGLAAACWVLAVHQMNGMDMGVDTDLGSFWFFAGAWVPMMAGMMLPGAAPALMRRARARAVPLFAASYIAIWTLAGLAAYALYQPHSVAVAAAVTIAAGIYELTPFKRECRRRCRADVRSGFELGLYCVGSSAGLMAMFLALGAMNVAWMAVVAVVVIAQKLIPPKASIDIPLALAIVAVGIAVAA
jgi:predicted metal-binding membrane protein